MIKLTSELDLSNIPGEDFRKDFKLRAAVVREGKILGATILDATKAKDGRLSFAVEFDPPIIGNVKLPCPVTLIIGPDVSDRELLGIETTRHVIDFTPRKSDISRGKNLANNNASIKVDRISVSPVLYRRWLILCRTYTIRGRVVCRQWKYDSIEQQWVWCDEPVPGATVETYDVDCFLWWTKRDLITTTITNVDGTFEVSFRWCCLLFYPWLRNNWIIDQGVLQRIKHTLIAEDIPVPPIPPQPDPLFLQDLLSSTTKQPGTVIGAAVSQSNLSLSAAPGVNQPLSAEAMIQAFPNVPELVQLRCWPWWPHSDCAPDIVFRVTQPCNGEVREIYTETNTQTRWNISTLLDVTLLANDKACCLPTCRDPECPECLTLSWVGCVPADLIGNNIGPLNLRGYAHTAASLDRPFYGNLSIRGGIGADVDYFKVQYSKNGGAWINLPVPAFGGYTRRYWDGSQFIPVGFSPDLKTGQTVIRTRRHFEDLNPAIPRFGGNVIWDNFDSLFVFDTDVGLTPDALYQLRFVGYSSDSSDELILSSERILPTCGQQTAESIYIRVDNQANNHPAPTPAHPCTIIHKCTDEPESYIRKVCKNEGQPDEVCISACDIVRLSPTDTLTIHFTATCPTTVEDGHLGGYWLRAEHGISGAFYIGTGAHGIFQAEMPGPGVQVGPSYSQALVQGAPRPHWYGGDYKVTITGADFPECCAYLFRLRAWKRTTNGCSSPEVVHWNQFSYSFTVLRPELCPDVCP